MLNKLVRLVREQLPLLILLLKLVNEVLELVNKAVNYDRSISQLRIFVPWRQREANFCAYADRT